jgi:hypothetical protein
MKPIGGPSGPGSSTPGAAARGRDPLAARALVQETEALAKGYPDRVFGSEQGRRAARHLAERMADVGLSPLGDGGSFLQRFEWGMGKGGKDRWRGQNVVGFLEGSDPKLKDEVVIVSAHYDVVQGTHEGANDNATGCAGVLAIAEMLARNPPKRSVVFVTFDGEEGIRHDGYNPGRRGSKFYTANPPIPLAKSALMVNLDELAMTHMESGPRNVFYQWASDDRFAKEALAAAWQKTQRPGEVASDGYPEQPREAQMFTTDAEPPYRQGVPVVNLLSGRYLDNHTEADGMQLMIPERFERYARLAYAVVTEAANRPETLREVNGLEPGGLKPNYPLIAARKDATNAAIEEEATRLDGLSVRMPRIRDLAFQLLETIDRDPELLRRAGIDAESLHQKGASLLDEPVLNWVRERHFERVLAYHDIPKDALERERVQSELAALAGIEGVLAGARYLTKLGQRGNTYFNQRIPERLADLAAGAAALGLADRLAGVVDPDDTRSFEPILNADRAIQVARDTLGTLNQAIGRAVRAIADPLGAAADDRPPTARDAESIQREQVKAARRTLGHDDDQGPLSGALLTWVAVSLNGLRGSGDKWLERWASKNRNADFAALAKELGDDLAASVGEAVAERRSPEALRAPVLALYRAIAERGWAGGAELRTIDDLVQLSRPGAVGTRLEARRNALALDGDRLALEQAAAQKDPEVERLGALGGALEAYARLAQLYRRDPGSAERLRPEVSLADVEARLAELKTALDRVPDPARVGPVVTELEFWSSWISGYRPLEALAAGQAAERTRIADRARTILDGLWRDTLRAKVSPELGIPSRQLESVRGVAEALEYRQSVAEEQGGRDIAGDPTRRLIAPLLVLDKAVETLLGYASTAAMQGFVEATEQLARRIGDASVAELRGLSASLERIRREGDARLGRGKAQTPLGVLAVRAQFQREE